MLGLVEVFVSVLAALFERVLSFFSWLTSPKVPLRSKTIVASFVLVLAIAVAVWIVFV
jgi:hypothetical protein